MPVINLPDGKKLNFEKNISGLDIAKKINKSLSKSALVMSVDGDLKDMDSIIDKDCSIRTK